MKSNKADFFKKNTSIIAGANFMARTLDNKVRQKIIAHLLENKKSTVTELVKKAKGEQSIISQNLAIFRAAKLVTTKRQGKYIFYSLHKENFKSLMDLLKALNSIQQ